MADVFAGCSLERLPPARALSRVRFFEFAPRAPLPTLATLARARKNAPAWPQVSLVAPRSTWTTPRGPMRAGPELDAGVDWLKRVSDIVSAFAIVIATGADLTTGERDRDLLAGFLDRLRPTGRTLVVAPRGLWDPEHAIPFVEKVGAVYGFDPLEHDAPPGSLVYARVRPMGARPRLTDGHLAQIAQRIEDAEYERAYVALESDNCGRETKQLTRQLSELAEANAELEDDESDDDSLDEEDEEEDESDDDEA